MLHKHTFMCRQLHVIPSWNHHFSYVSSASFSELALKKIILNLSYTTFLMLIMPFLILKPLIHAKNTQCCVPHNIYCLNRPFT